MKTTTIVVLSVLGLGLAMALAGKGFFNASAHSKSTAKPGSSYALRSEQRRVKLAEAAKAWHMAGNLQSAEQTYRDLLGADPGDSIAWRHLAMLLDEKGDRSGAKQAYGALLGDHSGWGSSDQSNPALLKRYAELCRETGDVAQKRWAYERIWSVSSHTLGPQFPLIEEPGSSERDLEAAYFSALAIRELGRRNWPAATSNLVEALRLHPSSASLRFYAGYAYAHQGDRAKAEAEYGIAAQFARDPKVLRRIREELSRVSVTPRHFRSDGTGHLIETPAPGN